MRLKNYVSKNQVVPLCSLDNAVIQIGTAITAHQLTNYQQLACCSAFFTKKRRQYSDSIMQIIQLFNLWSNFTHRKSEIATCRQKTKIQGLAGHMVAKGAELSRDQLRFESQTWQLLSYFHSFFLSLFPTSISGQSKIH